MEGTPAKFLIEARIMFVRRDGLAYSFRYMAQATPKGTENRVVIKVSRTVPIMAGKIPPCVIPFVGKENKNFIDKLENPLEKMSHRITPKNKTTIKVLPKRISQ